MIGGAAEDNPKPGDGITVSEAARKKAMPNESVALNEYSPGRNLIVRLLLTTFTPTNEKSEEF